MYCFRETIQRAQSHRSSSSWFSQWMPGLHWRSSNKGYSRIHPSIYASQPSFSPPTSSELPSQPQRGSVVALPPQLIGRSSSPLYVCSDRPCVPEFGSTSLEGLRRRRGAPAGILAPPKGAPLGAVVGPPLGIASLDEPSENEEKHGL